MGEVGKVDPTIKMAEMKPYVILLEDKAFQAWVRTIEGELDELKEFSWQLGGIDRFGKFTSALNELGMVPPTSQAEMLQLWMCFRAVANYWTSKMAYLKSRKVKYEFLQKQLEMLNKIEAKDSNLKKKGGVKK